VRKTAIDDLRKTITEELVAGFAALVMVRLLCRRPTIATRAAI
jgi:hypothetical protein